MSRTTPKSQLIIGYSELVNPTPPKNRLNLLDNLSKEVILGEIAGLNYRLKTNKSKFADTTLESQQRELYYFCGTIDKLFKKYNPIYSRYINNKRDFAILFTRASCLFAMEEIVNSDLRIIPDFSMTESWESLFQYLLCVNNQITHLTDVLGANEEKKKVYTLEDLNPRVIPLGELAIDSDPVYVPYRSYHFMEFLSKHGELGIHFNEYLQETYAMGYEELVYNLLSMYAANNKNGENNIQNPYTGELDTTFIYHVDATSVPIFQTLSQIIKNDKPERLLNIRKYPFLHIEKRSFLLFDNMFLLDKGYNQLINDFWFDRVKGLISESGKPLINIRKYRSIIGYFFEMYTRKLFKYSFEKANHWVYRCFEELNVIKAGQTIELADFYVRYNNKIFLGQAKTTGLYDNEKFGGDVNTLYKNDREEFFNSFGINQIFESIRNLEETVNQFDYGFPFRKSLQIYPAIIVNDKSLQTPFMANVFNGRFQELQLEIKIPKMKVHPLAVIHVSDLEQMEDTINDTPKMFWHILDYNKRDPKFIPPFYSTLNQMNIKARYRNPKNLFYNLIPRFQIIPESKS